MKKILLLVFTSLTFLVISQENDNYQSKIEVVILEWADTTFSLYKAPEFKNYKADFTEEFLMMRMREKEIQSSKAVQQKEKMTARKAPVNQESIEVKEGENKNEIKAKKEESIVDKFHPKVKSYEITFTADVQNEDSSFEKVVYKFILDDYFNVIKKEKVETTENH